MGQRRLATPQKDDTKKRPQSKKSNNAVLNNTTTRKGEVFRAQRRTSENVNLRASDRKSTRLNSSHLCISYAVFC